MYPKVQAQNFLGRNSSQAASTSRKSDHSTKPLKPQQPSQSGYQIRRLLDKVEEARKSSGKAEKLKKRLPFEAGLYLEHPSIFNHSKQQLNQTMTKLGGNSEIEEHRQLLRRFPASPFENVRFMPVGQIKRKPEPVLQSCSPMSPQFDYLVAKTFLQGESTEMEARASRISKLQALCNKTASAVQELKNECRQGNFDLPSQTIGAQSQSQTTATNYGKKNKKIVTPIDLVNTGINLLYATTRVDSQLPEVTKLMSAQNLLTPKHKPSHAEDYGISKDSAFVKFGGRGGLRAQSAVQRKRQANMIQLINKTQGTESLPGLHDKSKHRRIQSALHRYESESGTGFNSQLLKNYLRPKSTDTRLTQVEIQYLSGFIEKRLKEANTKNLQPSEMKELIESAIQQFLNEKQKQIKLPEIEPPLKKSITKTTNRQSIKSHQSQKNFDVITNKSKTTIKSISHIEIQDIDSHQTISSNKKAEENKKSITNSKIDQSDYLLHLAKAQSLKQVSSTNVLDQSEPIKTHTSPTKVEEESWPKLNHRQSMMQNMLLDGIWKSKWQDLKPILDQRKRQERQSFFKQDSRQGNLIFQQIYDRDINNFKAMLKQRNSEVKEPQADVQSPPPIPQEKQKTPRKKDSRKRRTKSSEKLNIDISQVKGKKSHRSQKPSPAKSARQSQQSHRSKRSQHSNQQPSQSARKSVNFGLSIGQNSQQLAGIEEVIDTVKILKKQITRRDTLGERRSPSTKRSGTLSSPLQRGKSLKIILSRLSNGLTAFVDQNIDAPYISEEVKAVMQGLRNKQALASGLSKAQLAVVVDEIKTELELLQKKASYSGHALHLMNLVDYYKPLESPKPTLAQSQPKLASTTNILIKTVGEDLSRTLIKKVATFSLGQALEPIQPEIVNKENPNMKYIKPIEEQKIAQLLRGSVKNSVFEEELEFKMEACGGIAKGLLGKEQLKVHLLDWKSMDSDIKESENFFIGTEELLVGELPADSFEGKHGFNIMGKFLATTDLIRDEHCEPHLRRTNSMPRPQQEDSRKREQPKAGCNFWPKAFESEHATSLNEHLYTPETFMAVKNSQKTAQALREEITNGKSLLYDEFWSENGRLTDLFSEELRMQSKWTVDEEEKVNRLEGHIMQQIEGIEVYSMIAPKHSDKSKQVAEVEKMFQKRGQFVTGSFLDVSQVPDCSRVVVLNDWKLKCLNQDALEFKCIGNPNTKQLIKTFQDALKAKIKREAASYIEFADIKLAEPSVDLLWLLYFDEQLISSMANILSTPFNPIGVLENIRMELNIVYINQFEKYLLKIKGKRMKRVGINFQVKKAKLLAGAQQFFGDQVVRRYEAQSKIAVHFMRSNRQVIDANEYLLNFSQVLRPHRELQSTRDIHELKKQFSLPTIFDFKNDVAMQPYITHDLTPLTKIFRNKNDRSLYGEHRTKLVQTVWGRFKSNSDEPLDLVTLSSEDNSEKSEKDYDSNPTQVGKSINKVSTRKSKPLFYQYAPVLIEQFPYELNAFGDRVNIIHKDDTVHSLFKIPVRLYQHFHHVSGFQFYRKTKETHQEITFYDIYLPARKKPLISKLQDALRQMLTRKLLEMQQDKVIRKESEKAIPKVQTVRASPVKESPTKQVQVKEASPELAAKDQPLQMSKSKSAGKKQKFKPAINVGTTIKKSKSSYPGSKEAGNLTSNNKKSPSRQSYLGSDFQSQLTYLSKHSARRSSRKQTMKAVIYAHPQKKKQIEVGVTAASPQNRRESDSNRYQGQQELPMRRATSALIKGDQSVKSKTSNLPTPKHKQYTIYKTFDNKSKSAANSSRSAVTYSKVSETQSVSDTPDYSPISQSLIKANKEPCEPSKPLKLIAASELVKQYPMTKISQVSMSEQALNLRQQLIDARKSEGKLSPKKSTMVQLPLIFASMSDSVSSSNSFQSNKPSRAEKLQRLLEEKVRIKKEKLKLARAKSKKKAYAKEFKAPRQRPTKIDTPKKQVKRIDTLWKESESSPDWQVNKSNKAPKQFQLNLLQSPESPKAVTPTYPKFISKKTLQQLKRKMQD